MSGILLGAALLVPLGVAALVPTAPTPAIDPAVQEELTEIIVQTTEPKYAAPTRRDRIGRIWAPVLIDGKGPYRMVLDTGANHSAITERTAQLMAMASSANAVVEKSSTRVTGFTGSMVVPTVHVNHMEVGELYLGETNLPVLADVFGGAQGVLGIEGLFDKRIVADFGADRLTITRSHGEPAPRGFETVGLRMLNGLLVADVYVGRVKAKAIIDTGAQGTVGNLKLRDALNRQHPRNVQQQEIMGVTLDVQSGDWLQAPDVDFGKLLLRGIHITFGDMYLFQHWNMTDEPALTIGMDMLGSFDVLIIDYTRHEMQIRPRPFSPFDRDRDR
ncbi:MAG: clan AA aspartic protease [Proteobacteria bacterium]|nr:clan AA aspartic protease [Pseudomonadota bacterium]